MDLQLVKLRESISFISLRKFENFDIEDISELLMMYLISLQIIREEDVNFTKKYAYDTMLKGDYSKFYGNLTDLYSLMHIFFNNNTSYLKNKLKTKLFFSKKINEYPYKTFLYNLRINNRSVSREFSFLRIAEIDANIKNSLLKTIRNEVIYWKTLTPYHKYIILERLTYIIGYKLPNSDILSKLLKLKKMVNKQN